jgi:hypothetical protein
MSLPPQLGQLAGRCCRASSRRALHASASAPKSTTFTIFVLQVPGATYAAKRWTLRASASLLASYFPSAYPNKKAALFVGGSPSISAFRPRLLVILCGREQLGNDNAVKGCQRRTHGAGGWVVMGIQVVQHATIWLCSHATLPFNS